MPRDISVTIPLRSWRFQEIGLSAGDRSQNYQMHCFIWDTPKRVYWRSVSRFARWNPKNSCKHHAFTRLDDIFCCNVTNALNFRENEADTSLVIGRKALERLIGIWTSQRYFHSGTFCDIICRPIGIALLDWEHRVHEFDGVISFQISCAIIDDGVGRGARLIKSVACEFFDYGENLFHFPLRDIVAFFRALDKDTSLVVHYFNILLHIACCMISALPSD